MTILRVILSLTLLVALIAFSGGLKAQQSNALAATPLSEDSLARDAATSRIDISLTNSCIEAGQSKRHCLCVTKVFKHEMSLREYKAATQLYQSMVSPEPTARSATKMSLIKVGYAENEIKTVDLLQRNLSDRQKLENRCAIADAYFNQASN